MWWDSYFVYCIVSNILTFFQVAHAELAMKEKEILDIEGLYERYHIYSTYQKNIFVSPFSILIFCVCCCVLTEITMIYSLG
jgi:hypothetical protein